MPDVFLDRQLGQPAQRLLVVDRAGRVRRRAHQDDLGARRDRACHVLEPHVEVLVGRGRHIDRPPARELDDVVVADPRRRRDDDLVAFVDQRVDRVVQRLLRARAHDDLGEIERQAVRLAQPGRDRLAQRDRPFDQRVLGVAGVERLLRRLLDMGRRVEVGLTRSEADDVDPLGLQCLRLRGHGQGGRGLNHG